MLMIYHNAELWAALAEKEQQALMADGGRRWRELVATGEAIMGEPLADGAGARAVRVRDDAVVVTDGPFVEAKEQFVGFLLVDVATRERAVELATQWPDARVGTIYVREIRVVNELNP
ncbi:MAG TPA: YciI family protein [Thermomicrobiales bacterium]|nr:YciI family protein [Thermomicrobiales bacterium]